MFGIARPPSSAKLRLLRLPVRTATSAVPRPSSNSGEAREGKSQGEESRSIAVERRPEESAVSRRGRGQPFPSTFSDALDPFCPSRSLSQVLHFMDQLLDGPMGATAPRWGGGPRRGWDAREGDDGLYLRVDMPGLGKEDVKVTVEQSTLVVKGEDRAEDGDGEEGGRRYSGRIVLPESAYETARIRAEMKNGVLRVFVPKVEEEEERKDVVQVNIE